MPQEWPKIYGDDFHSLVGDVNETYDRGFNLSGFIYSPYGFCRYIWIIKIDINGDLLWDKKIGNFTHQFWLSGSTTTLDEGLVFSGATNKYSSQSFDPLFAKMNVCGELEWCQVLTCPDDNYGVDIISQKDGSFIGLLQYFGDGDTYARISLVKMDQNGEPVWIQKLAQQDSLINNEEGNYLYLTTDNKYLVSGEAYHPYYLPFHLMSDTNGHEIWNLFWDNINGEAHQVIEKDSGIFYSTSRAATVNGIQSPLLLKFNKYGEPINYYNLMGDTILSGSSSAINILNDLNLVIGVTWRNIEFPLDFGYAEVFLTDTLANLLKRKKLLTEYHAPDRIIISSDEKIIVTGTFTIDNNFDIYLWKMNSDLEDDTLYTQPLTYDSLCPYEILSDTVDLDCGVFVNIDELPTKEEYESTIKISPNPAGDWIVLILPDVLAGGAVELVVYDIFGREAWRQGGWGIVPVNRIISYDVSGYAPGMYIAVVVDGNGRRYTGKFVVR